MLEFGSNIKRRLSSKMPSFQRNELICVPSAARTFLDGEKQIPMRRWHRPFRFLVTSAEEVLLLGVCA